MFRIIVFIVTLFLLSGGAIAQEEITKLTLNQTIEIARSQSPDALMAKHKFRASYWRYRSMKASYLPSLLLTGKIPSYAESIYKIRTPEGDVFSSIYNNNLSAALSLNQKIGLTGGDISLNSDLSWLNDLAKDSSSFSSSILNISYRQPLFQTNHYRWQRTIEPMFYEEAKKVYIEDMEQVSVEATNLFFNLLLAQINEKIALINEANYDTLYKIALGRFNLGKIAENDLLQLELQYLRAGSTVSDIDIEVENQLFQFKSFLRIKDAAKIELIIPDGINPFKVIAEKAVDEAKKNNSKSLSFNRQLIEAQYQLAQAKFDDRLDVDIFAVYGISNYAEYFADLKTKPLDQQIFEVGISMPIYDWGVARGKIKMAESNQEIVRTTVEQDQIDFDQEVFLRVARFNMQYDQVKIAAKADTVAQKGYDITKARYLIGKISITDLNIAQTEADNSKSNYINSLYVYWRSYYDLRRLTLYDFEHNIPIMVDYKELL